MSGGSYDYLFVTVESTYGGATYDDELDSLIIDLCKVLKELEWWKSGDTAEAQYRIALSAFKDKWLGKRDLLLRERILNHLQKVEQVILNEGQENE